MKHSQIVLLFAVVALWPHEELLAIGQSPASPPASTVASAPTVQRLTAATIERLLLVGAEGSSFDFLGIHKIEDGASMLAISSARQNIAYSASKAAEKGGRYTPPAEMRTDIVFMTCGDEDLGDRWDCGRLAVLNGVGRRVAPLGYSAGPRTYRNALGATWSATKVTATFRMSDLADGFSVRYAGTDGTEFTEVVPSTSVKGELLAELPPTKAMLASAAAIVKAERDAKAAAARAAKDAAAAAAKALIDAEPEPPPLFRGTLNRGAGDTWTITSDSPSYTWQSCELISGTGKMPVGPLAPALPVTVTWPATADTKPVVHCLAKGRHIYGPVPAEFAISVERKNAEFWIVRNLTDWDWKACEIVVAEKSAAVETLSARGTVTVTAGNFRPGPPRADAAPSVTDLTLFCTIDGHRVEAVQKPTP